MRLHGYVVVTNNSGEDYENAQTRLIVGKVHILDQIAELARRQYPYGRPGEFITEQAEGLAMGRVAREKFAALAATVSAPAQPKEIKKLQEIEAKYPQYSQDTEVVLAIHTNNEFSQEVSLDYIDEVIHKAMDTHSGYICRIVLTGEIYTDED
jgi:hypothetical protein